MRASADRSRARLSRNEDLLTVAFAAWMIVGLFVDGWAHNNDKPESFFTPWHGLFYSGFFASALWIGAKTSWGRAVPPGYGIGAAGVVVFAGGGVFDLVWHSIFGIELDLEALISPSHLVLFVGALMLLTSPLRSAWSDPSSRAPTLSGLLPALLSVTLVSATLGFFLMPFSPFISNGATSAPYRFLAENPTPLNAWLAEEIRIVGLASFLITTVVLMAPTLLLARRWPLPPGSVTLLFGTVAVLMSALLGFRMAPTLLAAVAGGFAGDLLARRLRPSASRPRSFWAFGAAVPAVLWLAYFGVLAASADVGWPVELWGGITVLSALAGFGLALLMVPPDVPEPADAVGRPAPEEERAEADRVAQPRP